MIALKKRDKCDQAEPYLFDCVSGDYEADIPGEIAEHVHHCPYCQGEMDRLKQAFNELDKDVEVNGAQAQEDIATCLKLHFNYVGKEVDCIAIKPFLPLLAMPDFQVRMPTPITVHLNHCSQCRKDCNAIQELELTDSQLALLSQVLADPKGFDADAQNATKAIESIVAMDSQEHVEGTKNSQRIRQVFSSMVHRKNSGVVTIYEMSKDVEEQALRTSENLYADWPIFVQVTGCDETQNESPVMLKPAISSVGLSKKPVSRFNPSLFRRAVKPIAAAAVILIALSFFFNTSAVEAVGLKRIYDALAKINNIHIVRFTPPREDPIREIWASKSLKLTLIKSKSQWNLWDLSENVRKIKKIDNSLSETIAIDKTDLPIAEKNLENVLGLMPFPDITDVPEDAKWYKISDTNINAVSPGTEVFELTWQANNSIGEIEPRKWRCYLDPQKHLPFRIERYAKIQGTDSDEFVIKSIVEVRYVEQVDVQEAIRSASF